MRFLIPALRRIADIAKTHNGFDCPELVEALHELELTDAEQAQRHQEALRVRGINCVE